MQQATSKLINDRVASRIYSQDYSLYDFDDNAQEFAKNFMGWSNLATCPPVSVSEVTSFANECHERGISAVYLIGMGGSSQAPMTVTKFNKLSACGVAGAGVSGCDGDVNVAGVGAARSVKFRVLDSTSPVRLRKALNSETFKNALVLVSSKSGGTLEPRMILSAVRDIMAQRMSLDEIPNHLVAITDGGSALEKQAKTEGWLRVFLGLPSVGGRFSALSVFGLVPAALAGVNIDEFLACAKQSESACSADDVNNPALKLAGFLYENYVAGRNKFCFISQKSGRTLGLWVEQLVAESLGKQGCGIVPCLEVNPSLQSGVCESEAFADRTFIVYKSSRASLDEALDFEASLAALSAEVPRIDFEVKSVSDLASHFVMWEYAVSMCGYLMQVSPFDQPDVQSAKTKVVDIIESGLDIPTFVCSGICSGAEVRVSPALALCDDISEQNGGTCAEDKNGSVEGANNEQANDERLRCTLSSLVKSVKQGDYFALNAFLPFEGYGRVSALEHMRVAVAQHFGVVSLLEVAPRFLHSSGQLHKGGPNTGVFLIVSGDELDDIEINEPCKTLGALAKAQAVGDWQVLAERERRAIHVHLRNNSSSELWKLAHMLDDVLESCY